VAAGVGIGCFAAWSASRLLDRFLFEVPADDLRAYSQAAFLLLMAAGAASYLSASRIRRMPTVSILKTE
jgi:hypothetical protein